MTLIVINTWNGGKSFRICAPPNILKIHESIPALKKKRMPHALPSASGLFVLPVANCFLASSAPPAQIIISKLGWASVRFGDYL